MPVRSHTANNPFSTNVAAPHAARRDIAVLFREASPLAVLGLGGLIVARRRR